MGRTVYKEDFFRLLAADFYHSKTFTVGQNAEGHVVLVKGGQYLVRVQPAATALGTATGVYWNLDGDATESGEDSFMWLSSDGYIGKITIPDDNSESEDKTLSMKVIGWAASGDEVYVEVHGLTPESTTEAPA